MYTRITHSAFVEASEYLATNPTIHPDWMKLNVLINGLNALLSVNVTRQGEVRYYANAELCKHLQLEVVEVKVTVTKLPPGFTGQGHIKSVKKAAKAAKKKAEDKMKAEAAALLKQIHDDFDEEFDL